MPTAVRAWLVRYGLAIGIAFAYLYSVPYFPAISSANELPRAYLVKAMVERGTVAIDDEVQTWGATPDVSPSGGHQYSNKAPGSSMLAIPPYAILTAITHATGHGEPSLALTVWLCRVTTGVVPSLLFLWLLWGFLARWAPRPESRRLVIAAYALGSMAMTYSVLFISHQLSAVCIGTAWILAIEVIEDRRALRWMLAAGFAAGAAPLVDYQAAFAGVPIAIYVVWRLIATRPRREVLTAVGWAAAGAVVPIAILLAYHTAAFGGPLRTGYAASETFAQFHQQGFLGITALRAEAFLGSTVSADNGLVTLAPWLLAAIPGWWLLWRGGERRHAAVSIACVVIYLLFVSSINFWRGGWGVGPRYITAMLPFLLPPIAAAVAWTDAAPGRWWARALVGAAVVLAIVIYAGASAEYPHFPEKFKNPLYEVTLRLMREGHAPWNAGWLVGLRGLASLVPYLIVVAVVIAFAVAGVDAVRARVAIASIAGGLALVLAYAAWPGGGPVADEAYVNWVESAMPGACDPPRVPEPGACRELRTIDARFRAHPR
ncbi:MAG: hypothetical protein K8W52_29940 [Deltaproteobacteria bacterium]|nr:hypothetical protein [Deltaproteobacteria bacterium]